MHRPGEDAAGNKNGHKPTLKNVTEVRTTLGLLGYLPSSLDPHFLKMAKPLTDLLGKGREWVWNQC